MQNKPNKKNGTCTYSFVKTDDRPQATAQRAAATQTAAKQPLHIDGEVLSQTGVHATDAGLEFFWGNLEQKC